jgi:hypothetical protein
MASAQIDEAGKSGSIEHRAQEIADLLGLARSSDLAGGCVPRGQCARQASLVDRPPGGSAKRSNSWSVGSSGAMVPSKST